MAKAGTSFSSVFSYNAGDRGSKPPRRKNRNPDPRRNAVCSIVGSGFNCTTIGSASRSRSFGKGVNPVSGPDLCGKVGAGGRAYARPQWRIWEGDQATRETGRTGDRCEAMMRRRFISSPTPYDECRLAFGALRKTRTQTCQFGSP